MEISDRAKRMILDHEGLSQPSQWPGGQSGITLGHGYDLGHQTAARLREDWERHLGADVVRRLEAATGKSGASAKALAPRFRNIRVTREAAGEVFAERTLPRYIAMTERVLPGVEILPDDARGALVSLIYNRGGGMKDKPGDRLERRREMRAVRDAVARGDLAEIAAQLRAMKRLWEGRGLDGLLQRREDEARLVEMCIAGEGPA
jgi:GH24 family phage-related lysozyme (muramidase)